MMTTTKKGDKRPVKGPPPRDHVLRAPKSKVLIELPGPNPKDVGLGAGKSNRSHRNYLRAMAGVIYMIDESLPTIEDIQGHEYFRDIPISTLRKWAARDGWVERRREFREKIIRGVRKEIGSKLVKQQIKMLTDGDLIYRQNLDILFGDSGMERPPTKSYEGVLRAHTMFCKMMSETSRDVMDAVVPPPTPSDDQQGEPEIPQIMPELTIDEARIAALAVVEQRRKLRARNDGLNGGDDDDDET